MDEQSCLLQEVDMSVVTKDLGQQAIDELIILQNLVHG